MIKETHRKIKLTEGALGTGVFADYYRFGIECGQEIPMVVYIGGASDTEEYRKRSSTAPEPIVAEFRKSLTATQCCIDLLVIPYPPQDESFQPSILKDFFSTLLFGFLPGTENPRPSHMAFVGYSIGASIATYLALSLAGAKCLVTFGGYQMTSAAEESIVAGDISSRKFRAYWNYDSDGYMENLSFVRFLDTHGIDMEIVTNPGEHDFSDYASNGSVIDAFDFVHSSLN